MIEALNALDAICAEIEKILSGYKQKNKKVEVFEQNLPVLEDEKSLVPYVRVMLEDGGFSDATDPHEIEISIMAAVHEEAEKNDGYRDALIVLNKICHHFFSKRIIAEKYVIADKLRWQLANEDTYPFSFAGMVTTWEIARVQEVNALI